MISYLGPIVNYFLATSKIAHPVKAAIHGFFSILSLSSKFLSSILSSVNSQVILIPIDIVISYIAFVPWTFFILRDG